ncbi:hypothetical protein C8A03DRAFT_19629, partial [Achaetomium macrosporum]
MIKCDGQWPACANCIRSKKLCSGHPAPRWDIESPGESPRHELPPGPTLQPDPQPVNIRPPPDGDSPASLAPGIGIDNWRYTLSHDGRQEAPSSPHHGLASRLSTAASELFSQLLAHGRPSQPSNFSKSLFRKLGREYSCLQLWCDGYGLASGDLDVVLAESRRLRCLTVRLLARICYTLADKLTPVSLLSLDDISRDGLKDQAARTRDLAETAMLAIRDTDHTESDSDDSEEDGDSETGSVTNYDSHAVEDIVEDLKTDIQCLVDLGPRFKEPVRDRTDKEEAAAPPQETSWDPAEYLTARILLRFPEADPVFARILGQANWDRAQRLYSAKEMNTQSAEKQVVEAEPASRAPGTVLESAFHDSGLGTSIPTASYAETVLSYYGTNGNSIRIPPIPTTGRQGKSFECPICGCRGQLPADRWKTLWKRHVLSDLQPYVCITASCGFSGVPFPDKMAWMQHLELEHGLRHEITCPLCQERIRDGPDTKYASHLARHLEEVSLMILPANAEPEEDKAGYYDNDDEPIMSSDVPPPLLPPRLVPMSNQYLSDSASDEEASRCNTPSPTPNAEMASHAEPHAGITGTVGYACPECGKAFARLCNLNKHSKSHSRPYKCHFPRCKYSTLGWPTAKELQRHINDKHLVLPRIFPCLFQPCPYWSKRESNCKQHMEKAHNWAYVRQERS